MANFNLNNFELFVMEIEALKKQETSLNQEVINRLKSEFNEEAEYLEETASSFNTRLHDAVETTKQDIDIKVESMKSTLDSTRETMLVKLDFHEKQLRRYFLKF